MRSSWDKLLFKTTIKRRLCRFFDLTETKVVFKRDEHYTTDAKDLERLFGDSK